MAKEIALTQGKVAIVSDDDYEWLMQWKWFAACTGRKRKSYARRGVAGSKNIHMHREVVARFENLSDDLVIDHINGNTLDNRRENLRAVTHGENMRNQAGHYDRQSQFRGVMWSKQKRCWQVMFTIDGSAKHFGFYESAVVAAVFANDFIRQRDGSFAVLNDVPAHIDLLARDVPSKTTRRRTRVELKAQRAHAAMVDAAYADWQAQHTASPANEAAVSTGEAA